MLEFSHIVTFKLEESIKVSLFSEAAFISIVLSPIPHEADGYYCERWMCCPTVKLRLPSILQAKKGAYAYNGKTKSGKNKKTKI